jgi:hypothetical protein
MSHMGQVLAENRNGLIMTIVATGASGTAERTATLDMLDDLKATHGRVPATLGGDKGYDDGVFFQTLEDRKIEPHVPLVKMPVDPKTVTDKKRLPGIRARRRMKRRMETKAYQLSQRCRKKVEEPDERPPLLAGVPDSLAEQALRHRRTMSRVEPAGERGEDRSGSCPSHSYHLVICERLARLLPFDRDLAFDAVQGADRRSMAIRSRALWHRHRAGGSLRIFRRVFPQQDDRQLESATGTDRRRYFCDGGAGGVAPNPISAFASLWANHMIRSAVPPPACGFFSSWGPPSSKRPRPRASGPRRPCPAGKVSSP